VLRLIVFWEIHEDCHERLNIDVVIEYVLGTRSAISTLSRAKEVIVSAPASSRKRCATVVLGKFDENY